MTIVCKRLIFPDGLIHGNNMLRLYAGQDGMEHAG